MEDLRKNKNSILNPKSIELDFNLIKLSISIPGLTD